MAYLDSDGLRYLWTKIKSIVPTKTSDITNDSGFITDADIPEGAAASTAAPLMDGTAATGSSNAFARGDHVHPSDTTKVDKVAGKGLSTEDYTTAEKTKLAGFGDASTYALKSDLTSMYKYKGSVATVSALPAQNNTVGDRYSECCLKNVPLDDIIGFLVSIQSNTCVMVVSNVSCRMLLSIFTGISSKWFSTNVETNSFTRIGSTFGCIC